MKLEITMTATKEGADDMALRYIRKDVDRLRVKVSRLGFDVQLEVATDDELEAEFVPKLLGGGFYQLSDGSKVRGKEAALEAQAKLG